MRQLNYVNKTYYKGWFVTLGFIPKLTEEDKGNLYLSLLDEGRAASAGSDQIRSLYSAVKAYNLVYIIIQLHRTFANSRNLCRPSPASLKRGALVHMELSHISPHPAKPHGRRAVSVLRVRFHLLSFVGTGTV